MKLLRTLPWFAVIRFAVILLFCTLGSAEEPWQAGRIVNVTQTTDSRTPSWIVSTPLTESEKVCVILVHVSDKLYSGSYVESQNQPAPPQEWIKGYPVRVQFAGDHMLLRTPHGNDLKLKVSKRKGAPMMSALTPQEETMLKAEDAPASPTDSLVGYDESSPSAEQPPTGAGDASSAPSSGEPAAVKVAVSSVPYLADLYVDGQDVGYTPAKVKLSPGKHTLRCEKKGYQPWTKDITVTPGSEVSLDITLSPRK